MEVARESKALATFALAAHISSDEISLKDDQCCQIVRASTLIGSKLTILKNGSDIYVDYYKVNWKAQADDGLILGIDTVLSPMKHHGCKDRDD
jgi:hypothetical protein